MKMPFGKHKGEDIPDIPSGYLRWFLSQDWCDDWPDLVEETNLEMKRRDHYDDHLY